MSLLSKAPAKLVAEMDQHWADANKDLQEYIALTRELLNDVAEGEQAVATVLLLPILNKKWNRDYSQMVAAMCLVRLASQP